MRGGDARPSRLSGNAATCADLGGRRSSGRRAKDVRSHVASAKFSLLLAFLYRMATSAGCGRYGGFAAVRRSGGGDLVQDEREARGGDASGSRLTSAGRRHVPAARI